MDIRKAILHLYPLGRLRFQPLFDKLHRLSLIGMNYGSMATVGTSGELLVLRHLRACGLCQPWIVFDVGANVGEYAAMALSSLANRLHLYCFEPSCAAFARLQQRLGMHPNVSLHNFAFGRVPGKAPLFADTPGSELSSLFPRRLLHASIDLDRSEEVEVRTLDEFCETEAIHHIHLLKLDTECSEWDILQGAQGLIESKRIDIIQFEFGGVDARVFLQDFFLLLDGDYRIYRIVRDGLSPIDRYSERYEIFQTCNYVAVARSIDISLPLKRRPK